MGRREIPVDPFEGPAQRFAHRLRKLRQEAGGITYRTMAARAGCSATVLSQAASGVRLPTWPVVQAYVSACGGDPAEWEPLWRQTAQEMRQDRDDDDGGPYPGLVAFGVSDAARFFGRDQLVATLLELVEAQPLVAVVGPSGSGKSSLVRAGLIPALNRSDVVLCTPGAHPLRKAERLTEAGLIIVDQFEEAFTLVGDADERNAFIDFLLASSARAVIVVRADFYGRCAEHQLLADSVGKATLLVGAMGRQELREAIVGPASAEGLTVERALTAAIVEEVAGFPAALPLMAHTLRQTWRQRQGKLLSLQAYHSVGGIHGAISRTAEDLFARLPAARAPLAQRVLLRLIQPGEQAEDTRRPVGMTELNSTGDPDQGAVIESLTAARLITLNEDTVELTHEALINSWPRLRGWVDEGRDRLRANRRFTEAAATWAGHEHDTGALYRGEVLSHVMHLFADDAHHDGLTPSEQDFLQASMALARRSSRRRRLVVACLAVLLVMSLMGGGSAVWQANLAGQRLIEATARLVAKRAAALRQADPELARQLSVAAWALAPLPEAHGELVDSVTSPLTGSFDPPVSLVGKHALSPDGTRLASHSGEQMQVHDVRTGRLLAAAPFRGSLDALAWSADGTRVALAGTGRIWTWSPSTSRPPTLVMRRGKSNATVRFSPSGRLLSADETLWMFSGEGDGTPARLALPDWPIAVSPDDRLAVVIPSEAPSSWDFQRLTRTEPTPRAKRAQLWDLKQRKRINAPWLPNAASAAAFSPDGGRLAVGLTGEDEEGKEESQIHLYNVATGQEDNSFTASAESIAFSRDGQFLISTGWQDIQLWRVHDGAHLFTFTSTLPRPIGALAPDNRLLRVADALGVVQTIDVSPYTHPVLLPAQDVLTAERVFSADGRLLVVVNGPRVKVWDVRRRSFTGKAMVGTGPSTIALSGDGRTMAMADSVAPVISLWDVPTQSRTASLSIGRESASDLALSPDGRVLAAFTPDTLQLWDTSTRRLITQLRDQSGSVLAFHPAGTLLYAGIGADGVLLDPLTGRRLAPQPDLRVHGQVIFSDTAAASADPLGRMTFWTPDLSAQLASPQKRESSEFPILVPDTRHRLFAALVTGDAPTIQIWDWRSHTALGTAIRLPPDSDPVIAFDGSTLVISTANGIVREIPLGVDQAVRAICASIGPLPPQAWAQHIPELPYRATCPTGSG